MAKTFSSFYNWYMRSDSWKEKRRTVLKRDGYKCVKCGSRKRLEIHHKHYENLGNEELEDLETLCRICHRGVHRRSHIRDKREWIKQARKRRRKG